MSAPDWNSVRLTYGITPPKASFDPDRRRELARVRTERIAALPIDALVVYDLQDESSRTDVERPFPFMRAVDPLDYAVEDLAGISLPKIVYRSVSGQTADSLTEWMGRLEQSGGATVFVGAPSKGQSVSLRLGDAYELRGRVASKVPLGGVLIAERHEARIDEDQRVLRKVDRGCSFFITQAVYSVTASKDVLSDLYYRCQAQERDVPPILVTLTPCGSRKTLEFLAWLGISVPRWLQNELANSEGILDASIDASIAVFEELLEFAQAKGIPLGCNVESVSLGRAEIDASVEMVHRVARLLGR